MASREKFEVSFDDQDSQNETFSTIPPLDFVGDILERDTTSSAGWPAAPTLRSKTGFPPHTKRQITSRFKQKHQDVTSDSSVNGSNTTPMTSNTSLNTNKLLTEKQQIDLENQQRLAAMSEEEIEEARQELFSSFDSALLQSLLKRADINTGSNETADLQQLNDTNQVTKVERVRDNSRRVAFDDDIEEVEPVEAPSDEQSHDSIHFPRPHQPPELDPNSETFLEDLHSKYFPSLPSDPDKLEWMREPKGISSYDPSSAALSPKHIRFDFKGALIPPSEAADIPVPAGLHNHGDAPEAAGYTIPELAHLSRSTYAPQRCIAFQTLGRILYKLGKKEFGDPGEPGANTVGAEDTMGELARGLWREMEAEHVIAQLIAESEGNGIDGGKHVSAKAYATEAVWLWQRGGGRRWKAD